MKTGFGIPPSPFAKRKQQGPIEPRAYPHPGGNYTGATKVPGAVKGILAIPGGIVAGFLHLRRKRSYPASAQMGGYQGELRRRPHNYARLEKQRYEYQGNSPFRRQRTAGDASTYAGNMKVRKGQMRYENPGRGYVGNHRMRREKGKMDALLYNLRQLRFGLPVKPKGRYAKTSRAASDYVGDFKYRKRGKDMHPSAAYLTTRRITSANLREKHRKWSIFINRLFGNKQQPKHVRQKKKKLRYDKKEREIWEDWQNTRSPKNRSGAEEDDDGGN